MSAQLTSTLEQDTDELHNEREFENIMDNIVKKALNSALIITRARDELTKNIHDNPYREWLAECIEIGLCTALEEFLAVKEEDNEIMESSKSDKSDESIESNNMMECDEYKEEMNNIINKAIFSLSGIYTVNHTSGLFPQHDGIMIDEK